VTGGIQDHSTALLGVSLKGVKRIPFERARRAPTTHPHSYQHAYIDDLASVVDLDVLSGAKITLGVDPLGGAGVHYWRLIGERYRLPITVVSEEIDPTFRFMTVDWDGKIRMDPSSPYAMQRLLALKDRFDVACACDTDHDRHGIVAKSVGLMKPNDYLAVAISYLFTHRAEWSKDAGVGKTVVSSSMIDRVVARLGRPLFEVPVGFKWFVDGFIRGSLGFGGEESAGASFLRRAGTVWTTDKDGIVPGLLAAEMTARTSRDPGELYRDLTREFGEPVYQRIDAPATAEQKRILAQLSPQQVTTSELAGEKITSVLTLAPGNNAPIGGLKVVTKSGWFAARPSGTEDVYKLYGESFKSRDHLTRILDEARALIEGAFQTAG
jgi:phosphoglucomutase